jgi:tryptophanyl-tRNA synthetase
MTDSKEVMQKKIMKAVTTPEGRKNLEFIAKSLNVPVPTKNLELKENIIKSLWALN